MTRPFATEKVEDNHGRGKGAAFGREVNYKCWCKCEDSI